MAAKARGVRFGQKPVNPETVESKLTVARQLLTEGKTVLRAAETVGWSRATLYRYLKQYGAEQPPIEDGPVAMGRGRSQYANSKPLPPRDWHPYDAPLSVEHHGETMQGRNFR